MVKGKEKLFVFLNSFSDYLIMLISYFISTYIRFYKMKSNLSLNDVWSFEYLIIVLLVAALNILIFYIFGVYDSNRKNKLFDELTKIYLLNFLTLILLSFFFYIFKVIPFSRIAIILIYIFCVVFLSIKRIFLKIFLYNIRIGGYNQKHVLIIGSGSLAKLYYDSVIGDKKLGYTIDGYLSEIKQDNMGEYLGSYDNISSILAQKDIDEIIVALNIDEMNYLNSIIEESEKEGIKLSIIPYYNEYLSSNPVIDEVGSCKLINIKSHPLDKKFNLLIKRLEDIILSLIAIILTSPIMMITAIIIKMTSKGPVLFRQKRVGLNKRQFIIYKFRSMNINDKSDYAWTTNQDSRKTKFGSLIRKFSIDELPQFFNVLLGDMSIVGPRPEIDVFVNEFKESIPKYMLRHLVKPGITGWAQVNGLRGDTSIKKRIEHDIWYIDHWSLSLDIKIIFMTIFGGMVNKESLK